jgi:hypothetical protein
MVAYVNRSGRSGVVAYEVAPDSIIVEFTTGRYRYDYDKPGRADVEAMKRLAHKGEGLATYISKFVGNNYAAKLR